MAISASIRRKVETRANHRCEYCGLSAIGQAATFHIDHVVPLYANGPTLLENLALACVHCSLRKGARRSATHPQTGEIVPLFNPRTQQWNHHFRWKSEELLGITPTGIATVHALQLNSDDHRIIHSFERQLGRHPPPGHV